MATDRDPAKETINLALNSLRLALLEENLTLRQVAARMQIHRRRFEEIWYKARDIRVSTLGRVAHAMNRRVIIALVPDEGPPYTADVWEIKAYKGKKP